jgi:hypothetical protein
MRAISTTAPNSRLTKKRAKECANGGAFGHPRHRASSGEEGRSSYRVVPAGTAWYRLVPDKFFAGGACTLSKYGLGRRQRFDPKDVNNLTQMIDFPHLRAGNFSRRTRRARGVRASTQRCPTMNIGSGHRSAMTLPTDKSTQVVDFPRLRTEKRLGLPGGSPYRLGGGPLGAAWGRLSQTRAQIAFPGEPANLASIPPPIIQR